MIAVIVFLLFALLVEYLVILYSMDLGVADPTLLRIDWPVAFVISPLFHLVPMAVIITLGFTWTYLTKKLAIKSQDARRGRAESYIKRRTVSSFFGRMKTRLLKVKAIAYIARSGTKIKSALMVFITFLAFAFVISLLAYPQLVYRAVASAYQNNPSFLGFVLSVDSSVRGFAQAVAPVGWIGTAVNNVLLAGAPGLGQIGQAFGHVTTPLAVLRSADKYLLFQNLGAWISVIFLLFYVEFTRKGFRYRKK